MTVAFRSILGAAGRDAGGGSAGGITYVSSSAARSISNNVSVTKPAGVAEGDVLVLVVGTDDHGSLPQSVTSSGFTEQAKVATNVGYSDGVMITILTKVATASEPSSYTVQVSNSAMDTEIALAAFRGADQVSPVEDSDTTTDTNYNSDAVAVGPLAATADGAFVGAWVSYTGQDWTPPGSATALTDNETIQIARMWAGYEVGLSAGTVSRSATPASNCRKIAGGITLTPASS